MINQFEIPAYLHTAIPEIDEEIKAGEQSNAFKLMHTLVEFTSDKVETGDMKTVSKCFGLAEKLYDRGNSIVKNAVDNVFVYSLSNLLCRYPQQKKYLLSILPMGIYTLYIHQLHHTGC